VLILMTTRNYIYIPWANGRATEI